MQTQEHPKHAEAINAFWEGLRPDPLVEVDEWADRNRKLTDVESSASGQWKTSRTPYLREPMRVLSNTHPAREVALKFAAQVGKSETGNNWIGYCIDFAPGPMLLVQPTVEIGKRFSRQRISKMIGATPRLSNKIKDSRSRDSGNTTMQKEFPGGLMVITGANSAAGLRSMPIRYLFMDEVDAYPVDVDGEGDPCELAEARTRTFARKKILYTSTPTFEGRSTIDDKFQEGDQRHYYVPCPHCDHMQTLKWSGLQWKKGKPKTARYVCEDCGVLIDEHHKTEMLARGEWRAHNPDAETDVVSFHLNSLYSPVGRFAWWECADKWIKAQGNQERLRTFVNTVLGETWSDKDAPPDWKILYDRREKYKPNTIPEPGVLFLTAGVDVQADRLEVEVVGWGRDKQSWSIDHRVFFGDIHNIGEGGPWAELAEMLTETWVHTSGVEMSLVRMAVDEGYETQTVRSWVRKFPATRVLAVMGSDTQQVLLGVPQARDVSHAGKRIKRGLKTYNIGVSIAKSELYGWLNQEKPTEESGEDYPAGYCHFPQYAEEWFKQLTAEQTVVRIVRGYRRYLWEKTRERNEALDLRVYARVAAAAFGIDRFKAAKWDELAKNLGGTTAKKKRSTKRKPANFLRSNRD